ncbi:MAG: glycosyltransferase family 2 protein, partial [Oscillospiraceae bacterium]
PKFLVEMLDSVVKQTYSNWELCLADGSDSEHADVGKTCLSYGQKDKRIVYKKLEKNCGISENTNACIAISTGEYISLFDHDDILHPAVLFEVAKVINEQNADFIYTDELTFSNKLSDIVNVHFKPDFAADNLRSNNYICHFSTFKRDLLEKSGYFNKDFDGSQDHDMILRLTENAEKIAHIPKILYYWRSHPNSVAQNIDSKQYAITAGIHAVEAQLDRLGMPGKVESSRVNKSVYRIRYDLVAQPLVSIIIPNKDHIKDLKTCVDSIYEKSSYSNFEIIIVENNSEESKTFSCYETLETHKNLKVVSFDLKSAFNYSDINNFGVEQAKGEQLIFLNNDIEVISENWIEEMLMFSQRKDVGAVGAKLYYSNNTVQHGGVIVGINGVASHAHKNFGSQDPGYFGRAAYQQDFSAVTAACMMMKKSVFCEVGGFDNIFAVAFNDVDICLRIREKGYLVAWTPYAELYHHESISRGPENTPKKLKRFTKEVETFLSRWEDFLKKGDPYYNPNLTLKREDFSLMNPIPLISND